MAIDIKELEATVKTTPTEQEPEASYDDEYTNLLYDAMTFLAYAGSAHEVTDLDQQQMLRLADRINEFLYEEEEDDEDEE